jgi:hypothetical protein
MLAGIIIYIAGCLLFAYLAGRFGYPELGGLAFLWPIIVVTALVVMPWVWLATLGERHGNAASRVGSDGTSGKAGGGRLARTAGPVDSHTHYSPSLTGRGRNNP